MTQSPLPGHDLIELVGIIDIEHRSSQGLEVTLYGLDLSVLVSVLGGVHWTHEVLQF